MSVTLERFLGGLVKMYAREQSAPQKPDHLGWKPGWLHQRDGEGGWTMRPTQLQFVHWMEPRPYFDAQLLVVPYGVAQMDNGEIILVGSVGNDKSRERVVVTFSGDGGESWTPLRKIDESVQGRPMSLTYLGGGELMFAAAYEGRPVRFFSKDYGRTWEERVALPVTSHGAPIATEGNYLVDRDQNGVAKRIAGFGIMAPRPKDYPFGPFIGGLHWSEDGGRTWSEPVVPKEWQWEAESGGKVYRRGGGEGSLVRAANGWIVAALRTDTHPRFFPSGEDNYNGLGVSISKDDGATWSPIRIIHQAGRHHTHLLCMPDGTLVLTFIMRMELEDGRLASYKRACCALLSYDNGLTWDTDHEYLVHSFDFADGTPVGYSCGHVYSTLLDDGSILTCYGHLRTKGGCLVKWRPAAG